MGTVASAPADFSVFRTLSGSTATLERAATLGEGLAISQWSRSARETLGYDMPGHHTLSLYLRGGEKSFRVGLDSLHGGAGKFCVLPAEHYSRWSMNDNVRFLHLYIAPERLARAVMRLDCEPRSLELRDRTYIHDDSLTDVCRSLLARTGAARSTTGGQQRRRDRAAPVAAPGRRARRRNPRAAAWPRRAPARHGLRGRAPGHPLTLAELAGVAALSTYHFARMFHTSFGEPPHAWCARAGSSAPRPCWPPAERPGRHRAGQRLRQRQPSVAGLRDAPASRRASIAAPAPDAEPARISPMGHRPPRPRAAVATWSEPAHAPGRRLRRPLREYWLAEIIRLRETHWGRSKTPRPCAPRAAEGGLPDRILVRAHRLADREQLPAQLQGWTRSALAVLAALFALALFSGIGLALGALGDGARPVNVLGRWAPCWACTR